MAEGTSYWTFRRRVRANLAEHYANLEMQTSASNTQDSSTQNETQNIDATSTFSSDDDGDNSIMDHCSDIDNRSNDSPVAAGSDSSESYTDCDQVDFEQNFCEASSDK